LAGASAATLAELLPEKIPPRRRRLVDDNLLIPLIAGIAIALLL
jgi:dolichol kinase